MGKVNVLIEVDEEILNGCKEAYSEGRVPREHNAFRKAIANGTPITDGDLINREALKKVIETYRPILITSDYLQGKNNMIDYCIAEIDNAPTVNIVIPETDRSGYLGGKNQE